MTAYADELLRVAADELVADARGACAICGAALNGRRTDARCCSAACRRDACRIRRLASGVPDSGYRTLSDYLDGRQRRAKRAWGAP